MFTAQIDVKRVFDLLYQARTECIGLDVVRWKEETFVDGQTVDEQDFHVSKARPLPLNPQLDQLIATFKNRHFDIRGITRFYEILPVPAFSFPTPLETLPRISKRFAGEFTWLAFYPPVSVLTPDMGQCFVVVAGFDSDDAVNAFHAEWHGKSAQEVEDQLNAMETE